MVSATDRPDAVGEKALDCVVDSGGSALGYNCRCARVVRITVILKSAMVREMG